MRTESGPARTGSGPPRTESGPSEDESQAPVRTESGPSEEKSQPVMRTRIRSQLTTGISISEAKCSPYLGKDQVIEWTKVME